MRGSNGGGGDGSKGQGVGDMVHLSPLAAVLYMYVYHMAFKKTIASAVQLVRIVNV